MYFLCSLLDNIIFHSNLKRHNICEIHPLAAYRYSLFVLLYMTFCSLCLSGPSFSRATIYKQWNCFQFGPTTNNTPIEIIGHGPLYNFCTLLCVKTHSTQEQNESHDMHMLNFINNAEWFSNVVLPTYTSTYNV